MDGASQGGVLEHLWGVYADYLPSRVAGGETNRAPDQADTDDPQRVAHAPPSAPITRSFSPESPTVTRLQPGYPRGSPSRTRTPARSKTSGPVCTRTKLPCEGM